MLPLGDTTNFGDVNIAKLAPGNLAHANLADTILIGACLVGAILTGRDLSGADLRMANLAGADIRGANVTDVTLDIETELTRARWPGNAPDGWRDTVSGLLERN